MKIKLSGPRSRHWVAAISDLGQPWDHEPAQPRIKEAVQTIGKEGAR